MAKAGLGSNRFNGIGKTASIIVVIVIIVLAGTGLVLIRQTPSLTSSSQNTSNPIEVVSTNSTLTQSCTGLSNTGFGFGDLLVGTSSPAIICVQLYYFGEPLILNLSTALSITALYYVYNGSVGNPVSFDGSSNFAIVLSQASVRIGGSSNENEGIVIAYAIKSIQEASGTYELGFVSSSSQGRWMMGSEPEECGYYGQLVAGNGQPNYVSPTHCITYTVTTMNSPGSSETTNSTGYHTVSGVSYLLLNDNLYFRVVGVSNSTR